MRRHHPSPHRLRCRRDPAERPGPQVGPGGTRPRNRNALLAPPRAPQDDTPRRPASRVGLALLRSVALVGWTASAGLVQAVLLLLPGRGKVVFARLYWAGICHLLGLSVRLLGEPLPRPGRGRPVVFISNHCSWLDIAALGGAIEACFVAKAEVAGWPVVGTVARLGRTVFVSRRRADTVRERDAMQARLLAGDNLMLFPEGTSSDGSRVLPFHSSFFAVVDLATAAGSGSVPGVPGSAGQDVPAGASVAASPSLAAADTAARSSERAAGAAAADPAGVAGL